MSVTRDELGLDMSTEGAPKCEAKDCSVSSSTESEEDDQESSSYALGYMPLSQDPDLDENDDDSCVETVTCLDDVTESPIKTDSDTRTIIGPSRHTKPAEDHTHSPMKDSKNNCIYKQEMYGALWAKCPGGVSLEGDLISKKHSRLQYRVYFESMMSITLNRPFSSGAIIRVAPLLDFLRYTKGV